MAMEIRGDLAVKAGDRFAVVVAEFNSAITARLADGAMDAFERHGAGAKDIAKVWVPGSLELATVAQQLALSGKFAAIVCLGCVIKGETAHFDHVAQQAAHAIAAIGPATGVPTIFGVLTVNTMEQAMDRAGLKMGNAGWNAACAAIEMASVMRKLTPLTK
ncbi:MAG: 6,7-dimethyl-8-ribityllumazine synthase [Phycisphaerales bacterium]|nr:6,7-dimethyl-8-ribityllumazine synthase [Phycisphaerales bacterium]